MLVASVDFPTPPLGLATTTTGMCAPCGRRRRPLCAMLPGMDEFATQAAPGRIHVLAAHPNWRESRVNRRLLEAAREVPGVSVCDVYGRYPDYDIDVAREQAAAEAAQLLVLQHPIQWYAMP